MGIKPQDILFVLALVVLLRFKNPRWFVFMAIACFAVAIPLYAKWVFFTALRLVMYGAAFMLTSLILEMMSSWLLGSGKKS